MEFGSRRGHCNGSMSWTKGKAGHGYRRYRYKSSQNATSIARRFTRLAGLKVVLLNELDAQRKAGDAVLQAVAELIKNCAELPPGFVEQVRILMEHCRTMVSFFLPFPLFVQTCMRL